MIPQPDPDWIAEETLAEQLNVPRDVIYHAREFLAPTDVDRSGPWVVWKKKAAAAFALSLGLDWPGATALPAPEVAELTVTSVPGPDGRHFPNPRIIRARKPDGTIVDVRVTHSRNFSTTLRDNSPMTFRAQKSQWGAHWELIGREPRKPRAW